MYEQITRNKRRSVIVAVLFVLVWMGIGAGVGALGGSSGTRGDGAITGMVVAAILALLGVLWALSSGRNLVLRASGAVPADPVTYKQLHNVVEELALADGISKPDVYVINDPSPNAFATGISPKKAAITATTGLLETMNREELEGVISHEMSHIKNYDVRLILIVSTLIGMAAILASIVWRIGFFARPRGKDSGQILLVIFAAGAALTIVAVIVGPLIKLALSRSRESLADVSGVELTRNPAGLIKALKKLQANDKPFAKFNHATASMCIDDPLQHHEQWFHRLFDTHPPIDQRIAVLEKIAGGPVTQPTTP